VPSTTIFPLIPKSTIATASIVIMLGAARASPLPWVPEWESNQDSAVCGSTGGGEDSGNLVSPPLILIIEFYRRFWSPAYDPNCTFVPSCSAYGTQAIRKHGPVVGAMMTAERIMRDHQLNLTYYPTMEVEGRRFYSDPLEANDFWFPSENDTGTESAGHCRK